MIIWINGTYGVGKTTIIHKLEEKLDSHNCKVISSDEFHKKNPYIFETGGGCYPQNNKKFNRCFKEYILEQKKCNSKKYIIIDMSLTDRICKEQLFEYFEKKEKKLIHFILTASRDTIKTRIKDDKNRESDEAIYHIEFNLQFLKENYENAIRIDTENKNIDQIAEEIIKHIKNINRNYHKKSTNS